MIDILVVAKDQPHYVRACIESVQRFTDNYTLYIWDNASDKETADYLQSIPGAKVTRSESNQGFLTPNNRLAERGQGEYIVLLNSDTIATYGWATHLISLLSEQTLITGYSGGILDENTLVGTSRGFGFNCDYIEGWALCLARSTYDRFGLFDEKHLSFAYGEDSDLSLRVQKAGYRVFASPEPRVIHFGGVTTAKVSRQFDLRPHLIQNHKYLRETWGEYVKQLHEARADLYTKLDALYTREREVRNED